MAPKPDAAGSAETATVAPLRTEEGTVASRHEQRERGVVLVITALMLSLLISLAGCAVDLGTWYLNVRRLQSAADAAALGGVVFLPNDFTTASKVAKDMALGHGYHAGEVQAALGERGNQLQVEVTREVNNVFLGLLGLRTTTIRRTALAEYQAPLPMGSPNAYLGNDPEATDGRVQPQHWMMVTSVRNSRGNGDRFHAGNCGTTPCITPVNPEYAQNGYFHVVNVTPTVGQDLVIQVFDAAFYDVGNDKCESNNVWTTTDPNTNANALRTAVAGNPHVPAGYYDDAHLRYVPRPGPWCTGDGSGGAATGGGGPVTTTYTVRAPDDTPWLDTDNPPISTATCAPVQYPGYADTWFWNGNNVWKRLTPNADPNGEWRVTFPPGAWRPTFANTFRRWSTVCRIPSAQVQAGDYLLQVRTNAPLGSPLAIANNVDTWGHNRHAIRAGFVPPGSDAVPSAIGARVHARGRLPIFVNTAGTTTQFHMSRVPPAAAGRVLNLTMWDISDSAGGSVRVVPPADATVNGSAMTNFSGCTFSTAPGTSAEPSVCKLNYNKDNLNNRLATIGVPVPSGYSCQAADRLGCWVKIEVINDAPPGTRVDDTTTWTADLMGNPVKLVE